MRSFTGGSSFAQSAAFVFSKWRDLFEQKFDQANSLLSRRTISQRTDHRRSRILKTSAWQVETACLFSKRKPGPSLESWNKNRRDFLRPVCNL
jgi:hypothetical protein